MLSSMISLEVCRLRKRLGHLVFFPWIQPEQARAKKVNALKKRSLQRNP